MLLKQLKARFPFIRISRLRCVRCVNENRKKRKRLRWQSANHGCHCFDRAFLLTGACVFLRENFMQQTQAPANRNAWSKQTSVNHDWLLAFLAVFV